MKQDEIKELMEFFDSTNLSRIKIKEDDFEIELEKQTQQSIAAPVPAASCSPINLSVTTPVVTSENSKPKDTINSPMVGTFYVAPSPGAKSFVKPGQSVKKGDVIGIIEAMKIMNEIEAEFDCRITEMLIADGQPVEFAMPLFAVEKI